MNRPVESWRSDWLQFAVRRIAVVFLLLPAPMTTARQEEKDPPVSRAGVGAVQIDVSVGDRMGKPIAGLIAQDFEVLENGREVGVVRCDSASAPLDLLFMCDTHSILFAADERALLEPLSRSLSNLPPGDRLAGMRLVDGDIEFVGGFTSALASIVRRTLEPHWTYRHPLVQRLYDALQDAAARFPKDDPRRRRAILVISDDLENGSKTSSRAATKALLDAGIAVYEIVTENVRHPYRERQIAIPGKVWHIPKHRRRQKGESLARICDMTGGERFGTLLASDFVNGALERLRQAHVLWFYATPGSEREFRTLTVRLAKEAASMHPGAVLRFGTGFYYEPPSQP